jgi:hypothetical protein
MGEDGSSLRASWGHGAATVTDKATTNGQGLHMRAPVNRERQDRRKVNAEIGAT